MSCGKHLIESLRKVGCLLENVDTDHFDWYFDDPKLGSFIGELCSRINSGHLSLVNCVISKDNLKTVAVESALTSEYRKYFDIERKMKLLELNISYKKNYAALLETKFQLLQTQKSKEDLMIAVLEAAAFKNAAATSSLRTSIGPRIRQLGDCLKSLMKYNEKLLATLLEQQLSKESDKTSNSGKTSGLLLNHSSRTGMYDRYLQKEKVLCDDLEEFAKSKLQPQKSLNIKTSVIEEWWREQLRLEKCFFMTVKEYNFLSAAENSLKQEIYLLKKLMEKEHSKQDLAEIQQLHKKDRNLLSALSVVAERNTEDCKQISSHAILYLLIASCQIKLEGLGRFKSKQERLFQLLREEQYRLSFLQFTRQLESRRETDILAVSQDICRVLRKHQSDPLMWIPALTSIRENQEKSVSEVVPASDHVMETVAQVLGSDRNELCRTFDSIVEAAERQDVTVRVQENVNQKNKENIWELLENLQIISEVLNLIQTPLDKNTQYHGDPNLCRAMLKLRKYMKMYFNSIANYEKRLVKYRQVLDNCPREVFERNQKLKAILQKNCLP